MKKLLVLVLVLGLASMVNATVVTLTPSATDVTPGQVITLGIATDATGAGQNGWMYLEMYLPSIATISDVVATSSAGSMASVTDYSVPGFYDMELNAADATGGGLLAGVKFTATITIASDAVVGQTVDIWTTGFNDGDYNVDQLFTLTVVPEPATIAVLSLGGLLLRRKK